MQRIALTPRPDWQAKAEESLLTYHSLPNGLPYWDESACYQFSSEEVDRIEAATVDLHLMCLKAVQYVIDNQFLGRLHIPPPLWPLIQASWRNREPSLYGRFDLCCTPNGEIKLFEYNADTPTSLIESSVTQWFWLEELRPDSDQFNSIHEKLIERWKIVNPPGPRLYFSCVKDHEEDLRTIEYLAQTAQGAGLHPQTLFVEDVGRLNGRFVDVQNRPIDSMFKLYPWEWMAHEEFGQYLPSGDTRMIEPAWKMILSNKGILPILWELFPRHELLLPAFDDRPGTLGSEFVRKPRLSREGANIRVQSSLETIETGGDYGEEGFIYQQLKPLPCFEGNFMLIGSWIIGDNPAGMGIREDRNLVTGNTSRFVPHYFE